MNSGDRGKVRERARLDGCSVMIYNYAWLGAYAAHDNIHTSRSSHVR